MSLLENYFMLSAKLPSFWLKMAGRLNQVCGGPYL